MNDFSKISYAKAQSTLKKFRYKSRKEWSDEDRILFKLCNFAVLSKKRLNNTISSIHSLSKLSDKSHYKYNTIDIKLIKEIILENLTVCFEKFKQKVNVIKESDILRIQDHMKKLKDENIRLENEIIRLNFIIESFISERRLHSFKDINEILKNKVSKEMTIQKKKKKTVNYKLSFDNKNIKEFIDKWNKGYTTFEITEDYRKINLDVKKTKKKRYKL